MLFDINCDMGEGLANDEKLMHYISSANIACGYHAGNVNTMNQTVLLAKKFGVNAGAHPSFNDRDNFGRIEVSLSQEEIYELVQEQIKIFSSIALTHNVRMRHVKPHGALYNMSAKNQAIAHSIASAIKDYDPKLYLFGLNGSHSITEGQKLGLKTMSEVFADRTYQDDGSLTPRSQPGALITDTKQAIAQALQMINKKTVTTVSGKIIPVVAETICIHGDGEHAVEIAKALYELF